MSIERIRLKMFEQFCSPLTFDKGMSFESNFSIAAEVDFLKKIYCAKTWDFAVRS